MAHITKQLEEARPSLRIVSPMSWWLVHVMGWFNILLGLSFLLAIDQDRITASFLIVNDILTFKFWGIVFILIGIVKLYSLKRNKWGLARKSLLLGVSVKAAWAIALTVRTLVSPGTVFLNLLWITVALLQMGCYVWFMPPAIQTNT